MLSVYRDGIKLSPYGVKLRKRYFMNRNLFLGALTAAGV
ncbi:MAG: hypothetical protein ACJAUW_002147, partial [Yoonia sp.]